MANFQLIFIVQHGITHPAAPHSNNTTKWLCWQKAFSSFLSIALIKLYVGLLAAFLWLTLSATLERLRPGECISPTHSLGHDIYSVQ